MGGICCKAQKESKSYQRDYKRSVNMLSTAVSLNSYLEELPNVISSQVIINTFSGLIYYPSKYKFCNMTYLPKIPGKAIQTENNTILLVGSGAFPFINTYKVDFIHQTVLKLSDLNQGRFFHALANLKNRLYAIGGNLTGKLKHVERFDGDS